MDINLIEFVNFFWLNRISSLLILETVGE